MRRPSTLRSRSKYSARRIRRGATARERELTLGELRHVVDGAGALADGLGERLEVRFRRVEIQIERRQRRGEGSAQPSAVAQRDRTNASLPAVHLASWRDPGEGESRIWFPLWLRPEMSGFDFSNVLRNEHIGSHGPQARSTGTTIVGCLFEGGIVLGADSYAFRFRAYALPHRASP